MEKMLIQAILSLFFVGSSYAQQLKSLNLKNNLDLNQVITSDNRNINCNQLIPLFTVDLDNISYTSSSSKTSDGKIFEIGHGITFTVSSDPTFAKGYKGVIIFTNQSRDTVELANMVPLGQLPDHIYITGSGPMELARARLFRPGLGSIGVNLPDNAWEMGYCSVELDGEYSVCAISRRIKWENSVFRRYRTFVAPGGTVTYTIYADLFKGEWQNGLKLMFHDRWLYDLDSFDNSLFEREDLKWIRKKYLITLQYAWDKDYYDYQTSSYGFDKFLAEGKRLMGGYDVYGIWPTWPRLGVDSRNQWDLYRDLPGGLVKMRELADYSRKKGTKFFIEFNPWDQSTREENPYKGMAELINATWADGVVLDTRGSSSYELQKAADSVKHGVVMYSEGMAVTQDMPGIVSGRVHDAIFFQPPLNLNKLIKPDFAIFRVCQLSQGNIRRETSISFFNGYGTEINTFAPGRPEWMEEEYLYLGKTLKILRENSSVFTSGDWIPLISTLKDSIWVNQWNGQNKVIFTIFSLIPDGYHGDLFQVDTKPDYHYISLWNNEEIEPEWVKGKSYLPVSVQSFNRSWLKSRLEGNVECVAGFPKYLEVNLKMDSLRINSASGDSILIWAGDPSYQKSPRIFPAKASCINLTDNFGFYEGKFVVQLFSHGELADQRIVNLKPGTPRLISKTCKTEPPKEKPMGMVMVPGGLIKYFPEYHEKFIPYPSYSNEKVFINGFYIDIYPVTNKQYYDFVTQSGYLPGDTVNYLKHWRNGKYLPGYENHPVVYVSLEDAQAYAIWAGKRLPTELEWQLAAQGSDERLWPWGKVFNPNFCNNALGNSTDVNRFSKGKSPFGVMDLVGNVWQFTNDVYHNGSYRFVMIKGGSFFKPTSSWWYVQGGPQPLNITQMLLLVSPGFDRNETVGFRCAIDAQIKRK